MPGFNQTGPEGQGSMTGRKIGKCVNKDAQNPNDENGLGHGRGFGQGQGLERGSGRGLGRQNRNNISN